MAIYLIADTHFCHDREFIWGVRGFQNVDEMNQTIIHNWNEKITWKDDVYMLGDFFLGTDYEKIEQILSQLKGRIHLVIGNHDTDNKIQYYGLQTAANIIEIGYAFSIKANSYRIMLSHYPMMTAHLETNPSQAILSLHGHIHTINKFYEGRPYIYNVCCDAQKCKPILLEDALKEIENEIKVCQQTVREED